MIIMATSPGRMFVTPKVITEMRNSVRMIERSRFRKYVIQISRRIRGPSRSGRAMLCQPRRRSRPQPDLMEVQVAPVRMHDRLEAADRGLCADGSVPEPEHHIVH